MLSLKFERGLAILLLLLLLASVIWGIVCYSSFRINLIEDVLELRERYSAMVEQRVDINLLKDQISVLSGSSSSPQSEISASSDRSAFVRLQQLVRGATSSERGRLISSVQSKTVRSTGVVAIIVRIRIPQENVSSLLEKLENGYPAISFDEVTLSVIGSKPESGHEVDIVATLRARWHPVDKVNHG